MGQVGVVMGWVKNGNWLEYSYHNFTIYVTTPLMQLLSECLLLYTGLMKTKPATGPKPSGKGGLAQCGLCGITRAS